MRTLLFYFLSPIPKKQARDTQKDSEPCYSLDSAPLFDSCECLYDRKTVFRRMCKMVIFSYF